MPPIRFLMPRFSFPRSHIAVATFHLSISPSHHMDIFTALVSPNPYSFPLAYITSPVSCIQSPDELFSLALIRSPISHQALSLESSQSFPDFLFSYLRSRRPRHYCLARLSLFASLGILIRLQDPSAFLRIAISALGISSDIVLDLSAFLPQVSSRYLSRYLYLLRLH
jgi:hypothetical protein